jgi:MoxR-like ATPase
MSAHDSVLALKARMGESIIGQEAMIERLLLGLLANGNLLVEGLPGLAKARAVKSLAKHLDAQFSRIQFTPDLLPADITGSEIYFTEGGKGEFKFQPGPVFANLVLAGDGCPRRAHPGSTPVGASLATPHRLPGSAPRASGEGAVR